jgi:hypothetical protein
MAKNKWYAIAVWALGLSACAGSAAAPGPAPQAPNGMVPYASEGSEADAIAAGVSPKTVAARAEQSRVAQNDCVQRTNPYPWMLR